MAKFRGFRALRGQNSGGVSSFAAFSALSIRGSHVRLFVVQCAALWASPFRTYGKGASMSRSLPTTLFFRALGQLEGRRVDIRGTGTSRKRKTASTRTHFTYHPLFIWDFGPFSADQLSAAT